MAVEYRSAAELAAEDIRHRIHAGQLRAGTKISITDLAADMRLSTTPVREALKALEREGLVSIAPRSGVYVRQVSLDEVAEVYAIKESLEPLIVRWAILRGTADQLDALVQIAGDLERYAEAGQLEDYVRTVEARHEALLTTAGSEVLATIFHGIDGRVRLLRYRNLVQPGRMRSFAATHQAIARAIADRDLERACALTAENVRSAGRSLLSLITQDGNGAAASATSARPWSLAEELMTPPGDGRGGVSEGDPTGPMTLPLATEPAL
jgi:GntR family transcriptional regulator, rspAB operon transcriptional repressor